MNVKICGIRRVNDARAAVELGASHIGIVRAPDSPRCAGLLEAARVVAEVQNRARVVLVYRGVADETIARDCRTLGVNTVQVHDADAARCDRLRALGLSPMPVAHVASYAWCLPRIVERATPERPVLLDGGSGGEGVPFAWSLLGAHAPAGVFVAGGIQPGNVRHLLRHRPWGIDVCSGVEREPGVKDAIALNDLFRVVRSAEACA